MRVSKKELPKVGCALLNRRFAAKKYFCNMTNSNVCALILAAGRGERMKSELVKVLHKAAGFSILEHVIQSVKEAGVRRIVVVIGSQAKQVRASLQSDIEIVYQKKPLGTGHAVLMAESLLKKWRGEVLVLPGDASCLKGKTLRSFIEAHQESGASGRVLTAQVDQPFGYGRVLRQGKHVVRIREELDASREEKLICEINSGIYLFSASELFEKLHRIQRNKKKHEYYLTDVISAFGESGKPVEAHQIDCSDEMLGVNTRIDLQKAHQILMAHEMEKHLANGVTIVNPIQTVIARGVKIGQDTVVHPFTWIDRDVEIGRQCEIGPFAKIRSGSRIHDGAVIGSFVEVVRTRVGKNSRVKHLSYLGDTILGEDVNVGAGTITANYDGKLKQKTVIEDQVFLGCNTVLVAPVTIRKKAKTGAGAVVLARHSVPAGKTVVGVPAKIIKQGKK